MKSVHVPHESGHAAKSAASPSDVYECTDSASEHTRFNHSAHAYPDSSWNTLSSVQYSAVEDAALHVRQARGHAASKSVACAIIAQVRGVFAQCVQLSPREST
eukprot:SAG11_NODE_60_length_19094_cov_26.549566_5_plen_103_part_00